MTHKARKRFGQNFLVDQNVIDKIIYAITPKPDDYLVEIGPGQGALSQLLLELCPKLTMIELDRDLIPILEALCQPLGDVTIYQQDVLRFNFNDIVQPDKKMRVIGNLPYNISTPLIFHLFKFCQNIQDMHFMLQHEVVQRMAAQPGSKQFGRLSVMVQCYCEVHPLFNVSAQAFDPVPKVQSSIVRLVPHLQPPHPIDNMDVFEQVVRQAFSMKRKTLRNSLKKMLADQQLKDIGIDGQRRPEQLSLAEFALISNTISATL